MLHLIFTQGVSEDLRSNIKTMKTATRKAGAEKSQAEDQKLKQVNRLEFLTLKNIRSFEVLIVWDIIID